MADKINDLIHASESYCRASSSSQEAQIDWEGK